MADQQSFAPAEPLRLKAQVRVDHQVIALMVQTGSKVLDIGCGDGALLHLLARERGVKGRGVELSQEGVNACVATGLSVVQGDADRDLKDYPDDAFDYVVLSKTIQTMRHPRAVLKELMRIGERAIVSLPNFGHWSVRLKLLTAGRMPMTSSLGCGIWGGNITNENGHLKHFMNVTWVSRPTPEDKPSEQELFGEYYGTATE